MSALVVSLVTSFALPLDLVRYNLFDVHQNIYYNSFVTLAFRFKLVAKILTR